MNAYWWRPNNNTYNLGDEITTFLLSELFSVEHNISNLSDADLISTGSILQNIWGNRFFLRKKPIGVVGSGFIYTGMKLKRLKFAKIYSVRGFFSRQLITDKGVENIALGDPGLLVSKALVDLDNKIEKKYKYGIIPHFTKFGTADLNEQYKEYESYTIIDFRTNDFRKILQEMLSCEIIISQALHGLILSDSFKLPNVWLDDGALHTGGNFKFYDYFSSVGRPFNKKINSSNKFHTEAISTNTFTLDAVTLESIQEEITHAFERYFIDFNIIHSIKNDYKNIQNHQ